MNQSEAKHSLNVSIINVADGEASLFLNDDGAVLLLVQSTPDAPFSKTDSTWSLYGDTNG